MKIKKLLLLFLLIFIFSCSSPSTDVITTAQCSPNPFTPTSETLTFNIVYTNTDTNVTDAYIYFVIYNTTSDPVWTRKLKYSEISGSNLIVGDNTINNITWNGRNDYGNQVNPGIYICRILMEGLPGGSTDQTEIRILVR